METDKLRAIVEDKNFELERLAHRSAEDLIPSIIREQVIILSAQKRIEEHRVALQALEVHQLDAKAILGEP